MNPNDVAALEGRIGNAINAALRDYLLSDRGASPWLPGSGEEFFRLGTCRELFGLELDDVFAAIPVGAHAGFLLFAGLADGAAVALRDEDRGYIAYDFHEENMTGEEFRAALTREYGCGTFEQVLRLSRELREQGVPGADEMPFGVFLETFLRAYANEKEPAALLEKPGFEFMTESFPDDVENLTAGYLAGRDMIARLSSGETPAIVILRHSGLTELPQELRAGGGPRLLDLSANSDLNWQSIGPMLKGMANLRILDLGYNDFEEPPAFVPELKQLEVLKLRGNSIRPDFDWSDFAFLKSIDLRLNYLPAEALELEARIRERLPETSLVMVWPSLIPDPFTPLSHRFADAPRLNSETDMGDETFFASHDIALEDSDSVPEILKRVDNLRGLMMIGGELDVLPEFMADFRELDVLSISLSDDANAEDTCRVLRKLPALRELELWTSWTKLPDEFAELKLERLDLRLEPDSWAETNRVLGNMTSLRTLELDSCWELTDTAPFASLSRLEHLSFGHETDLEDLFETLPNLPSLSALKAEQCFKDSVSIPPGLSRCSNLRAIYFFGNYGFKQFPSAQRRLEHLDIRETGLSRGEIERLHEALPECDILW